MVVLWPHCSCNTGLLHFSFLLRHKPLLRRGPLPRASFHFSASGTLPSLGPLSLPASSTHTEKSHNISVRAGEDDDEEASQWHSTALQGSRIKAQLSCSLTQQSALGKRLCRCLTWGIKTLDQV